MKVNNILKKPDWSSVRPIYKKLSDEFNILTDAYQIKLDKNRKEMLDHLIIIIDEVDLCIDELPEKEQRDDITGSLIDYLLNEENNWTHPLATNSLPDHIKTLKKIVNELNITKKFVDAASEIFNYTERKRHTTNENELIKYIIMEGEATARLPLSIMNVDPEHAFSKFFSNLCKLMGIADLIVDAKSDYKLGYIAVNPNLHLLFKLNKLLIKEGFNLIYHFPNKLQFLSYVIRFSLALIFEKEEKPDGF